MAEQLLLVRRDDYTADVDSLSLLPYLANEGWQQSIANDETSLEETLTLHVQGTSHDDLASKIQAIETKIEQINYRKLGERYQIWLRAQLSGETNARQAMVTSIKRDRAKLIGMFANKASAPALIDYPLVIRRTPSWEETSYTARTGSNVNCLGGTASISAPGGDVPARFGLTTLSGRDLQEIWIGFRSVRHGTLANFVSVWNLRKGAALTDGDVGTDAPNTDATAADGYKAFVTFATVATLTRRVSIQANQAAGTPADQRGAYLVLLRAKCTSSRSARVRLTHGWPSAYTKTKLPRVTIPAFVSWKLYEMGVVEIPPSTQSINGLINLDYYTMEVEAESTGGSGNLDLDCLILIPLDGLIHASIVDIGNECAMQIVQSADGSVSGIGYAGGSPFFAVTAEMTNGLPIDSSLMVVAGQRSTVGGGSVKGDLTSVTMQVWRRWRVLRGSA